MTSKEKAEELTRKFYTFGLNNIPFQSYSWHESKEQALIATDEIISVCKQIQKLYHDNDMINSDIDWQPEGYWQEVKQEIEKL